MRKILKIFVLLLISFTLISCSKEESKPDIPPTNNEDKNNGNNTLKDINVTISNLTVTYDGLEHEILVNEALPEGVSVTYTNNKQTNAGTYNVKALLKGAGFKDKELTATLTINKKTFSNQITLNEKTVTYDELEHFILVEGNLPEGTNVKYYYNNKEASSVENAGTYLVVAVITKDNYEDFRLTSSLVIQKALITTNFTFNSKTLEYDANNHRLELIGNIPSGTTITYLYNNQELDYVSEVGIYNVVAIISSENHHEKRLEATLTIQSTEEELYSLTLNNQIYFQNNLDSNKLYVYENNNLTKVNNDIPLHLTTDGVSLYYYSKGLFNNNITSLNNGLSTTLLQTKANYLTTDGIYLYYAINNLVLNTNLNGIYKMKISNTSNITRLTTDKAKYLTYHNNYIYYANSSEGDNLYKISTNLVDTKGTLVHDEKVSYITINNDDLYFTSSKTLVGLGVASAIYKYQINSNKLIKLTTDNGKYLNVVGDDLYYINNDKITSTIFGDGIYKVSTNITKDNQLPGIKVLAATNNGFSSLSADSNNLYYYKLNDKHFYQYNIKTEVETDLMASFVKDNKVTLSGYSDIKEYKNEIYYIDATDNSLYKYNPISKQKVKLLSDNISNFYFYNDNLYYSTYLLANYALYKMDLNSFETMKISSDRHDQLIFRDNFIYYIKVGSLYNNYLYKMDLNGENKTLISDTDNLWVKSLFFEDNTFFYTRNPKLLSENLSSYKEGDDKPIDFGIKAQIIFLEKDDIYYYNHSSKKIGVVNKNNTNNTELINSVEVNSMIVSDGILYYSSINKTNYGIYAYNINTKTIKKISDNVGDALTMINGNLYFMQLAISYTNDRPVHNVLNVDGELYYYNGTNVLKA